MSALCLALPSLGLLMWSLLAGGLPVVVRTNEGAEFAGSLVGFSGSSLRLDELGTVSEFAFDDLLSLRPTDSDSPTGPTYRVMLADGSQIAAQELSTADNELVIVPRRQSALRVPFKQVKSIRFRAASPATDPQWLGIVEREQRGDALVIRRGDDRLDPQQGLVSEVNADTVKFDLDGTVVNAPVTALEGLVFGGTPAVQSAAQIQVTDVYGSIWVVHAIQPSQGDEPLRMELSNSLRHELPIDQIESIRWSSGVRMLSQESAAVRSFQSSFRVSIDPKIQTAFFGPHVEGESDLRMHGGSSVEYRIEPGYRIVRGAVRRHEAVAAASSVTVAIELDGKSVWEQVLVDGELRGFELPLQDARRLTIRVGNDDDGNLGDSVRVVRPRLLK